MKAIMISIKPKWVAKILNGEKTIEIRKTMPKCDLPIDVYIYCTNGGGCITSGYTPSGKTYPYFPKGRSMFSGKVVAKFTLNKVEEITPQMWTPKIEHEMLEKSCLKENELFDYVCSHDGTKDKPFYAWHISNLEIFDETKYLCDFWNTKKGVFCCPLTKAPQSWCYVEELL